MVATSPGDGWFPLVPSGSFFQDCTGLQVISMHCGPTTSHGPHV
jgi:hypothetical protein